MADATGNDWPTRAHAKTEMEDCRVAPCGFASEEAMNVFADAFISLDAHGYTPREAGRLLAALYLAARDDED